ncbi:MAG: hypothetical protein OEZ16_04525 [Chromatiales bacterium]|nr:hypothetical protein [Chromatiales bacterium]
MTILFVYNANSGKLNTWLDIGHKLISPDTYSCNLCALTHGLLSEREEWKEFRQSSSNDLVFLHRDEFEKQYSNRGDFIYPIILNVDDNGNLHPLISSDELNKLNELEELISKVKEVVR